METNVENLITDLQRRITALENRKSLTFPLDAMTKKLIADEANVEAVTTFADLSDTPSSIKAKGVLRGDSAGTALDFDAEFVDLNDTPSSLTANKIIKVNAGGTSLGLGANYTNLDDTPSTIEANSIIKGNAAGNALEGGAGFIHLDDTPATIVANGIVRGNAAGTTLEFNADFINLNDTPSALTASKFLKTNAAGTSIELVAASGLDTNSGFFDVNPSNGSTSTISVGFAPSMIIFTCVQKGNGSRWSHGTSRGIATTMNVYNCVDSSVGDESLAGNSKCIAVNDAGTLKDSAIVTRFETTTVLTWEETSDLGTLSVAWHAIG